MADLRDYTKKNPIFVGTDGIRLPTGNSAQRIASSNVAGTMRYNTDLNGLEVYSPIGWTPLAAPPTITTVTPSTFSGVSGTEFTVNGTNFTSDAQVFFITANNTALLASSVSYYSPNQLRATTPRNITVQEEPISVRVVQQSGTVTKIDCIDAGGLPSWVTTAGTLGSIFGANTVNVYVTATDPEGTAVSYQLSSGSLPGGLSLSANGLVQGLANSVLANTTYNFVIKANDTVNNNTDRSFSYTILNRAPVINTASGLLGTFYSGNAVPSTTISAYDPDGGQLTFTAPSGNIVNTTIGSANGTIVGTPIVVTTNTTYTIGITATDEGSCTASNTYTFTVLNRPPLWNTAATLPSANADSFTSITVNAYDPDGAAITYTLTSGAVPSGLTFVSANSTIIGNVSDVQSNTTSTFNITATDVGNDSNNRTFNLTITPRIDSNFSNTILLLNATDSNTIIRDSSSNNLNHIIYGDSRATNFSPYNTSWSNFFDGSGDYLYFTATTPFNSTGDFTMEAWVYILEVVDYGGIISLSTSSTAYGGRITVLNTGYLEYSVSGATGGTYSSTLAPLNQWVHVALVRSGSSANNCSAYLNGNRIGQFTSTAQVNATNACIIGRYYSTGSNQYFLKGYVSNARYVVGTAVYSGASFSVPTTPLTAIDGTQLLTCQSNRFVDNSNNNFSVTVGGDTRVVNWSPFPETDTTSGSMYFDGTGDYVTVGSTNNWTFLNNGSNSTIEFWFNVASNTVASLLSTDAATNGVGFNIGLNDFGTLNVQYTVYRAVGGSYILLNSPNNVWTTNSWTHVAVTHNSASSLYSMYINGKLVSTTSSAAWPFSQSQPTYDFAIGRYQAGVASSGYFTGYISDIKISNTVLYGANTNVPTSIGTANDSTKLLTLQNRRSFNNRAVQDSSNNKFLINTLGNTSITTSSPLFPVDGWWSNYFSIAYLVSTNYTNYFASDFTLEVDFMTEGLFDSRVIRPIVTIGQNQYLNHINGGGWNNIVCVDTSNKISLLGLTGTTTINAYTWYKLRVVRVGATVTVTLNGASESMTGTLSVDTTSVGNLWVGQFGYDYSWNRPYWNGYISNLKLYNSSNTLVLHTCASSRIKDISASATTFGIISSVKTVPHSPLSRENPYENNFLASNGSIYFDGTGDYLTVPDNVLLAPRTGDFTWEAWIYWIGGTGENTLWCHDVTGAMNMGLNSSGSWFIGTRAGSVQNTFGVVPKNYWSYIAVSRSGTTINAYLNGTRIFTGSNSTDYISGGTLGIFAIPSLVGSQITNGYLSDLRFTRGQALYTGATMTVPTAPLTSTANTTLLIKGTNAGILDATGKNIVETYNDARANSSVFKLVNNSISFDGTTDFIRTPASEFHAFRTGPYTVEFWLNANSIGAGTNWHVIGANANNGWLFYGTNSKIAINKYNNPDVLSYAISLSLNTWYHIAAVREGTGTNQTKIYLNGNLVATGTDANDWTVTTNFGLGANLTDGTQAFTGQLSDVRITKSARYTSAFTPPTRSFPNK